MIRVFFLIPITIILTWLYNRCGGNLLTVAIFHAAMNTFPFVLPYAPQAMGLVILFAVIVIFTDRMWRLRPASPAPSQRRAGTFTYRLLMKNRANPFGNTNGEGLYPHRASERLRVLHASYPRFH